MRARACGDNVRPDDAERVKISKNKPKQKDEHNLHHLIISARSTSLTTTTT